MRKVPTRFKKEQVQELIFALSLINPKNTKALREVRGHFAEKWGMQKGTVKYKIWEIISGRVTLQTLEIPRKPRSKGVELPSSTPTPEKLIPTLVENIEEHIIEIKVVPDREPIVSEPIKGKVEAKAPENLFSDPNPLVKGPRPEQPLLTIQVFPDHLTINWSTDGK